MRRFTAGDTVTRDFALAAAAVQLPTVDAPRGVGVEGFQERQKVGFGKFFPDSLLRANEQMRLPEMLDRHAGIGFGRVEGALAAISRRRSSHDGKPCYMQVVVDGVIVYRSVAPGFETFDVSKTPPDLLMYDVASLAAVEVYRSAAETPIEFGGTGAQCGTVVLWTRRGP